MYSTAKYIGKKLNHNPETKATSALYKNDLISIGGDCFCLRKRGAIKERIKMPNE